MFEEFLKLEDRDDLLMIKRKRFENEKQKGEDDFVDLILSMDFDINEFSNREVVKLSLKKKTAIIKFSKRLCLINTEHIEINNQHLSF